MCAMCSSQEKPTTTTKKDRSKSDGFCSFLTIFFFSSSFARWNSKNDYKRKYIVDTHLHCPAVYLLFDSFIRDMCFTSSYLFLRTQTQTKYV